MREGFSKLANILFGRWVFLRIGAAVRFVWSRLHGKKVSYQGFLHSPGGPGESFDTEAFKSRLVGMGFVIVILMIGLQLG